MSFIGSKTVLMMVFENFAQLLRLLITQNDGIIWNCLPGYGFIYLFSGPFILLGIWKTVKGYGKGQKAENNFSEQPAQIAENKTKPGRVKTYNASFALLAWLVVSVLLGFIVKPNINRMNILYFPIIFFAAVGIYSLNNKIKHSSVAVCLVYTICFFSFSYAYFHKCTDEIGSEFFESFGQAVNYAAQKCDGRIYITQSVNMPYIFVLFYQKIEPKAFINSVKYANIGQPFQQVRSFDRYCFKFDGSLNLENAALILPNNELQQCNFGKIKMTVKQFKYYSVITDFRR